MTVTIFGATGLVGSFLVNQALYKGYKVRAFGRNVMTAGFAENENLELITGSLFDEHQVEKAVEGVDAVLSAIGGSMNGLDKSRSLGVKTIVAAMEKKEVSRILAVGGVGVLDAYEGGNLIMDSNDFAEEYKPVSEEHLKALNYLKSSGLKWTFFCPPMIVNAPPTGEYKININMPPEGKGSINAGDLSLFMLNEMTKDEYVGEKVGISN